MSDGLDGYHRVGRGLLALIEAPNCRVVALCEVRRLDIGPGQIPVTVLAVTLALLLTVAQLLALDAPTIRGELPNAWEAPDIPGLQHDSQGQNRPDTGYAAQVLERRLELHPFQHRALEHRHLLIGTLHHPQIAFHRQAQVGLRQNFSHSRFCQLLDSPASQ